MRELDMDDLVSVGKLITQLEEQRDRAERAEAYLQAATTGGMSNLWLPIVELTDPYEINFLLRAPELVDLDCNPLGVAPGYWQDGSDDAGPYWTFGEPGNQWKIQGEWVAAGYCMSHDHFMNRTCKPTHFIQMRGPLSVT